MRAFFEALGPDRCKLLTHVSADGADSIHNVVREKAAQAQLCLGARPLVKMGRGTAR